jgi:hypothetical protein
MADTTKIKHSDPATGVESPTEAGLINASGHRQELDRNFGLINICGLGITSGNTWIALGGSIVCLVSTTAM